MNRAGVWRAVAAEHLIKAQVATDVRQAALHMGIASDLHARALAEEIGATPTTMAGIDVPKLRATLRLAVSRG